MPSLLNTPPFSAFPSAQEDMQHLHIRAASAEEHLPPDHDSQEDLLSDLLDAAEADEIPERNISGRGRASAPASTSRLPSRSDFPFAPRRTLAAGGGGGGRVARRPAAAGGRQLSLHEARGGTRCGLSAR